MYFPSTSTLPQTRTIRRRKPILTGALGAALLATAAIGAWQTAGHREGITTNAPITHVNESSAGVTAPPARIAGEPSVATPLTVYLVSSQAEADQVQGAIAAGNHILAQLGQPDFETDVLVAPSAEAEQELITAHNEANAIRASSGLAPLLLVNLRDR